MGERRKVSSCCQLNKCQNRRHPSEDQISQVPVDLISLLPDEVLVFILSLLTIKEAARTSVLSSRWMNLWKYTRRLDFNASKSLERLERKPEMLESERHKYVNWVNRVLQLHEGLTLDEFSLYFDLDISYQDVIDRWLEYAFRRKVQRLELNLLLNCIFLRDWLECCDFPDCLLDLNNGLSKEQIHLDSSAIGLSKLIEFGSLRELCLKGVNVTGEVIESFLHNCPLLERLEVVGSGKLVNLLVSGSSLMLKHLEIQLCHNAKSVKICDCNNLVSLGIFQAENLVLMNLPMLAEVSVGGNLPNFWSHVFAQLSRFHSKLELLQLKDYVPQNIMMLRDFPQLSQVKVWVIDTGAYYDNSLMGLTSLIKACPFLHKFVLKLLWAVPVKKDRENEKGAKCTLEHLREIELAGYYGRTSDAELLMYFIENAVTLEKIVIDPRSQGCSHLPIKRTNVQKAAVTSALKEVKQLVPKHIEVVVSNYDAIVVEQDFQEYAKLPNGRFFQSCIVKPIPQPHNSQGITDECELRWTFLEAIPEDTSGDDHAGLQHPQPWDLASTPKADRHGQSGDISRTSENVAKCVVASFLSSSCCMLHAACCLLEWNNLNQSGKGE
ncbi:hypothetical protein ACH5RR_026813 [Cinchona calisaya]|uniref:F-box domain-containing protein n=1 Tax=Cinchona calisaya TaxID=153742 RepID=A0ABD2Z3Q2_9GENT